MLDGARQRFAEAGQSATFIQAPWQDLLGQLSEPYDLHSVTRGKLRNKHSLQQQLGLPVSDLPLLIFIGRLADQKGLAVARVFSHMRELRV